MEKVEAANRLGLAWVDARNARNRGAVEGLFCEDGTWETESPPPTGVILRGRQAIGEWVGAQEGTAPRLEVEEVIGLGFRGLVRFREAGVRKVAVVQLRGGLIGNLAVYTKG
jgi:hypothetical protein